MCIDKAAMTAARKSAASVARLQRQSLAIIEFAAVVAVVVSERFRANVHHDLRDIIG